MSKGLHSPIKNYLFIFNMYIIKEFWGGVSRVLLAARSRHVCCGTAAGSKGSNFINTRSETLTSPGLTRITSEYIYVFIWLFVSHAVADHIFYLF